MALQKTEWGEIHWIEEEQIIAENRPMKTGVVTVHPGGHQPAHIHYEEQVLYVLEGTAIHTVDGARLVMNPGDLYHWKEGIIHEVWNLSDEPFRHLLVSNPHIVDGEASFGDLSNVASEVVDPDLIYVAVEAVRTQFLETLHYGYALFDAMGNLILQSQYFPAFCMEHCQLPKLSSPSPCMLHSKELDPREEHVFHCCHGMEVYQYPIFFANHFLGYIQGGYIRHSSGIETPEEREQHKNVYDVPDSVVDGVKGMLWRIVKAIRNYCEFEQYRREMNQKELEISTAREQETVLLQDLKDTRYMMTDLKINNHFLFNTLNSMASMALDGGQMPLYQSIVDLSKMFHYTLRNQSPIVPLQKEMDYVDAYIKLQKLRFQDALDAVVETDPTAMYAEVPFNFLQPIVENAFVHGFHDATEKHLKVQVKKLGDRVRILVFNSGVELSEQELAVVNQRIHGNTAHGLSMITQNLKSVFEEDFSIEMKSAAAEPAAFDYAGVLFDIEVPYREVTV